MNGYELYLEYVSLRRHFSDWKYDYERYGPSRIRLETFEKRPDAFRFRRLASRPSARWSIVATLASRDGTWIGDCLGREAEERRDASLGRVQAMGYHLGKELDQLGDDLGAALSGTDGRHPPLARLVLGGRVSLEAASTIVACADVGPAWRARYSEDLVMESLTRRLSKLFPLMGLDRREMAAIIAERYGRRAP